MTLRVRRHQFSKVCAECARSLFVRAFALIAGILLSFTTCTHADPAGQLVRGATFEGAIFSPAMIANSAMKGDNNWDVAGADLRAHNVYWTPNPKLVRQAEAALAAQYTSAQRRMLPGGPHAKAYYSPKYYSPDRERRVPSDVYDNPFYNWDADLISPHMKRQYIGVTSNGRRLLLMHLPYVDISTGLMIPSASDDWKSNWIEIDDAGVTFEYDIGTGDVSEGLISQHL